jgi:hypothetical protein
VGLRRQLDVNWESITATQKRMFVTGLHWEMFIVAVGASKNARILRPDNKGAEKV